MISKKTSALIVTMFLTQICMADFWETVKFWESPKRPETVVITGNFVKSRLLAELIQNEEDCPLLLFSPQSEGGEGKFYHLPNGEAASVEKTSTLVQFLKFMNPKSVVVIGDEKYIGKTCADVLSRCTVPVTYFRNSSNWASNATDAGKFFKINDLGEDYLAAISQIDGQTNRATAQPARPVITESRMVAPTTRKQPLPVATKIRAVHSAPDTKFYKPSHNNTSTTTNSNANIKMISATNSNHNANIKMISATNSNHNANIKSTHNASMDDIIEIDMNEPEIDVQGTDGAPEIIEQSSGK